MAVKLRLCGEIVRSKPFTADLTVHPSKTYFTQRYVNFWQSVLFIVRNFEYFDLMDPLTA